MLATVEKVCGLPKYAEFRSEHFVLDAKREQSQMVDTILHQAFNSICWT